MDPIERRAAIDALCDNCDNVQAVCPHYPCKQYTAIDALPSAQPEQLERCPIYGGVCGYPSDQCYECPRHHGAQPEPQWIPCSERLPEDDDYRPCYGYDDGAVWWINDIGQMGLGWYYTSTKTWAYYDEISASEKHVGNVVAWMPLPEPYKEKDNERA